jgi:hypothetical protein
MNGRNVRYWPKADIGICATNVCRCANADPTAADRQATVGPRFEYIYVKSV